MSAFQVLSSILSEAFILAVIGFAVGLIIRFDLPQVMLSYMRIAGFHMAYIIPWDAFSLSLVMTLLTSIINADYPEVRFIIAHLGGLATEVIMENFELYKEVKFKENIFYEISGCVNPGLIRKSIEIVGKDRIFYGSDLPFFDPDIVKFALYKAIGGDLSLYNNILYGNILKVFPQYKTKDIEDRIAQGPVLFNI